MSIHRRRLSMSIASGLLLEGINKIAPLLILHHAQKYLGLFEFGAAQFGLAWLDIMQALVAFGYASYAVAALSRDQAAAPLLSHMTVLKFVQMLALLLIVSFFSPGPLQHHPLQDNFLLLVLVLSGTVLDASWLAMARQKLAYFAVFGALVRLGSLAGILLWVRSPEDRQLFMLLQLTPPLLLALATAYFAWTRLGWSSISWPSVIRMLRAALPFAVISLGLLIYDRYDLMLVERWFGLEAAGAYAGPAKVVQSLAALGSSMVAAFSAELLAVKERESLAQHAALSLWCMLAIATPIAFGAPFVADEAMALLFTHQTPAARDIFPWLCLGIPAQAFITVFGLQLLQLKGEAWKLLACLAPGLLLGPLLAWSLRSSYGWPVMAGAVLTSKWLAAILTTWAARPLIGSLPISAIVRTLAAGACMALVLYGMVLQGIMRNIIVGGIVYLIGLALLNRQKLAWVLRHPKISRYWRGIM